MFLVSVLTPLPKVDSVYTRSTPMMEAVKMGRLDLIGCLIRSGGQLGVQVGDILFCLPTII